MAGAEWARGREQGVGDGGRGQVAQGSVGLREDLGFCWEGGGQRREGAWLKPMLWPTPGPERQKAFGEAQPGKDRHWWGQVGAEAGSAGSAGAEGRETAEG